MQQTSSELPIALSQKTFSWFWLVQIFVWLAFALMTRITWLNSVPPSWTWVFSYSALGLIFTSTLYPAVQKLAQRSFAQQMLCTLLLALTVGMLWRICFNTLEYHVLESANNQFKFWGYFHNGKSSVMQVLIWLSAVWLLHYYHQNREHQAYREQAELLAKASQLKLLQHQINPHFLFNVLGNLDTLLLKQDTQNARKMLSRLTRFLRATLNNSNEQQSTIAEELELVNSYLEIEKVRLGERLNYHSAIDNSCSAIKLPTGVLIPLVENALKHGNIASIKGGYLKLSVELNKQYCLITLTNDMSAQKEVEGFHMGLTNVQQRLEYFYRQKASIEKTEADGEFIVSLKVPA